MKRIILTVAILLTGTLSYAQELSFENPVIKKGCATYELVSIDEWGTSTIEYTLYDGEKVSESGKFVDRKRSGLWRSYDEKGNVSVEILYFYGRKVWLKDYRGDKPLHIVYENGKPLTVTYHLASN